MNKLIWRRKLFLLLANYLQDNQCNERDGFVMKVMKLEELVSHDVLEFCYSIRYPQHWNNDSVFVDYDDFICLSSYLEQVIHDYPYFAPQKVTIEQWGKIERLALADDKYRKFFQEIREWKHRDPENRKDFWIYGV